MTSCVILHTMIIERERNFLVFDTETYERMGALQMLICQSLLLFSP
jgi:hypothetical protein